MATLRKRARNVQGEEDAAVRQLDALLRGGADTDLQLVAADGTAVALPAAVRELLAQLVHEMARGKAVAVLPMDTDLTTQEAADYLNVSRPYLIKLLEAGEIPFTTVGAHRRVRLDDVQKYQERLHRRNKRILDIMARASQRMGLYD